MVGRQSLSSNVTLREVIRLGKIKFNVDCVQEVCHRDQKGLIRNSKKPSARNKLEIETWRGELKVYGKILDRNVCWRLEGLGCIRAPSTRVAIQVRPRILGASESVSSSGRWIPRLFLP